MTPIELPVPWQGLNHLALITNDMDATVRFWHGVMGAPLVATIGTDTFRHYFFSFGASHSVAFFEYLGHDTNMVAKPAGVFDERAGQFDHLSLDLPDEAAILSLRQRLADAGTEVTDVVDHGLMRSIYFTDPERHRARGIVVGRRPDGTRARLHRRSLLPGSEPGARIR